MNGTIKSAKIKYSTMYLQGKKLLTLYTITILYHFLDKLTVLTKKKTNGCASHTTLLHNNIYFLWSGVPTLNSSYIHGRHFNMGQNVHPAHVYRRESQFSVFLYPSIMKQWIENSHAQKKELEG